MPPGLLNTKSDVYRRTSTGRDALNNPVYGQPVTGAGWTKVYSAIPVRLAFSSKNIQFAKTGERPVPTGVIYVQNSYAILPEDRFVTSDTSIQYTCTSVVPAYSANAVIDHYECVVDLP
jgi:hypothetical protein